MKRNKKERVAALLVAGMMVLTACSGGGDKDPLYGLSKKELVELAKTQEQDLGTALAENDDLKEKLRGIQDEEAPTASISEIDDGTGRLTFNSYQEKITFPKPFEYPESTQAPNTSGVKITNTLTVSPTANWALQLDGVTLNLEHVSGISGTIKAGQIKDIYPREKLQEEVFAPFFKEFPPDTIKFSKLFLEDNWWGMQAMTPTFIDSEPAYVRCGMLGLGEQCFVYMFVYKGEQDVEKDESILTLLQTVKMFNQQLRIEK